MGGRVLFTEQIATKRVGKCLQYLILKRSTNSNGDLVHVSEKEEAV